MPIYKLLDTGTVDATTVGTAVTACGRMARNNEALVQSEVAGDSADIKLEGRMTVNSAWTEIDTTSYAEDTNGSIRVALFPQMRATVENLGGEITSALVNLYTI